MGAWLSREPGSASGAARAGLPSNRDSHVPQQLALSWEGVPATPGGGCEGQTIGLGGPRGEESPAEDGQGWGAGWPGSTLAVGLGLSWAGRSPPRKAGAGWPQTQVGEKVAALGGTEKKRMPTQGSPSRGLCPACPHITVMSQETAKQAVLRPRPHPATPTRLVLARQEGPPPPWSVARLTFCPCLPWCPLSAPVHSPWPRPCSVLDGPVYSPAPAAKPGPRGSTVARPLAALPDPQRDPARGPGKRNGSDCLPESLGEGAEDT